MSSIAGLPSNEFCTGEKEDKIGEGTFANVYKGERRFEAVRIVLTSKSGKEKVTGRKGD